MRPTTHVAFNQMALRPELQQSIAAAGYTTATPIQAQAIPVALADKDILGIAQTGTGKTAAFTLPLLQRLSTHPKPRVSHAFRGLILTPTRELATQIGESLSAYGKYLPSSGPESQHHSVIFGGVKQGKQVSELSTGLDTLVATPGRLLDLFQQGFIRFDNVEVFVLDEADRMLDMGFIHDVRKIVAKLPAASERQTFFFSATMPPAVAKLAQGLLRPNPVRVEVTPVATTAEKIRQNVIFCQPGEKRQMTVDLLSNPGFTRVILFTRMKHEANKYAAVLEKAGIPAAAIHGNKSQSAREAALAGFKTGKIRVLCATDIAARGIDVEAVSHVVNTHFPDVAESYVHRIGRTARAGAEGSAVSFCSPDDMDNFKAVEKLIGQSIPEMSPPPQSTFKLNPEEERKLDARPPPPSRRQQKKPPGPNGQDTQPKGSTSARARGHQSKGMASGKNSPATEGNHAPAKRKAPAQGTQGKGPAQPQALPKRKAGPRGKAKGQPNAPVQAAAPAQA